jgi:hypothetical protein
MRSRLAFGALGALAAFGLVAGLAVTVGAQPAQPRVVQSSDGSLYLVQGGNAWPLVPNQIDDAELGALNLGGEVDGTLPATLLTTAAPAPTAIPTPPPAPPPPAPPPAAAPPTPVPPPAPAPPAVPGSNSKSRPVAPTATPTPPYN